MSSERPPVDVPPDADGEGVRIARAEIAFAAAERLTFFSDAVVAIAITLLALELPVPHGDTTGEMLRFFVDHSDEYVAFLVSFVVIGTHWAGHHRCFRYLRRLGGHLTRLNLLWLLTVVITPFATRVLTADGPFVVGFGLYAVVQAAAALLFLAMVRVMRRHDLTRPGTPESMFTRTYRRSAILAAAFLVSIPVALLSKWAFAVWAAVPILIRLARRVLNRTAPVER